MGGRIGVLEAALDHNAVVAYPTLTQ